MKVLLEKTVQGATKIWTSEVKPNDLLNLSKPIHQQGKLSVLMVENPVYNESSTTLQFDLESAILLNIGSSKEAIIVDAKTCQTQNISNKTPKSTNIRLNQGDKLYLEELNKLPDFLREIGKQILFEIRKDFIGELKFFQKSRKFVESPDNFWVVKIQPRAKSLRIVVYGKPLEHKNYNTIQLKRDMASYSSFVLSSKEQTQEAISAIKEAKHLKNKKK